MREGFQPVEKVISLLEETIMRRKTSQLKRSFHLRPQVLFPEVWRFCDKFPEKEN